MTNLKVTDVIGSVPMNIITGLEFEEAVENLEVLRATAGAASIQLTITNEGRITVSTRDMEGGLDVVKMEADL